MRAAAESMIPLISAVGHETDVTLIDFAADKRAPTPTAAAEMAVPVRADLLLQVDSLARRALACWQRSQEARRTELRAAARALPSAEELLALPRQRLDHAAARLPRALTANAQSHHAQFSRIAGAARPAASAHRGRRACREQIATLADRVRARRDGGAPAPAGAPRRDHAAAAGRRAGQCASPPRSARRASASARWRWQQRARRAIETHPATARSGRRALWPTAARALLSRRAGARLCAGARSRRPAVAHRRCDRRRACAWISSFPTAASAPRPRASRRRPACATPVKPRRGRRRRCQS